jgi:uncharacterized membrane protein
MGTALASTSVPHYRTVIDLLIAIVVIVGAVISPAHRALARRGAAGTMTLLLATAGVVSSTSMDEAMTLVAGVMTFALFSLPLWLPERRIPRHLSPG